MRACVRTRGAETIVGMRGREKTSDECIPRLARMRREHRAGGKGEAKDERKTEDGRLDRGGGRGGEKGRSATRRYPLHKDKRDEDEGEKREPERRGGRNAEGGVLRPSVCSVLRFSSHPRVNLFLVRSLCSSSSPLLSRRVSIVAQARCLLVSKKLLPPKKNIILIKGERERERERPVCTEWTLSDEKI